MIDMSSPDYWVGQDVAWGESTFKCATDKVWTVVKFITSHQHVLAEYRDIASQIPKARHPEGGLELLKYGDTRYGSRILMLNRFMNVVKPAVRPLFTASDTFNIWKDAASRDLKNKVRQVLRINCVTVNFFTGVLHINCFTVNYFTPSLTR